MRIALVHPTYCPNAVGAPERCLRGLGCELVARGHDVTVLTSHSGARATTVEHGIRVVRARRLPQPMPLRVHERYITNVPNVLRHLAVGPFDIAHAFFPVDACAAQLARDRLGGPPVIFSLHCVPTRSFLVRRRYRLEMLDRAVNRSDAAIAPSVAAAQASEWYFGRRLDVLPGGVRGAEFAHEHSRAEHPTLICAADLSDPRTRCELLFVAFERLRERHGDLHLLCLPPPGQISRVENGALPEGARWAEEVDAAGLPRLYARAWASVLPVVEEPFGLSLLESLAAGTPVVAARSGGCPEIVTDPGIGRLFAVDDERSLSEAIEAVLGLAVADGVAAACRAVAARWDWSVVADRYEELYARVQ